MTIRPQMQSLEQFIKSILSCKISSKGRLISSLARFLFEWLVKSYYNTKFWAQYQVLYSLVDNVIIMIYPIGVLNILGIRHYILWWNKSQLKTMYNHCIIYLLGIRYQILWWIKSQLNLPYNYLLGIRYQILWWNKSSLNCIRIHNHCIIYLLGIRY